MRKTAATGHPPEATAAVPADPQTDGGGHGDHGPADDANASVRERHANGVRIG